MNNSTPYRFALPPNAGKANIGESDNRIADAIRDLLNTNQQGLDVVGAEAVVTLVGEFFVNHRRGFLS